MTETSSEKTKRKYSQALSTYPFAFQTCFFTPIGETKETNSLVANKIRNALKKHYKFPILWKLKHIHPKSSVIEYYNSVHLLEVTSSDWQPYVSVYSTERLRKVRDLPEIKTIDNLFERGIPLAIRHRNISEATLQHKILAEGQKTAKPHDLTLSYHGERIRRWGLINKPLD